MHFHILSYFGIHTGNLLQTNVKIHPPRAQTSSLHYTYSFLNSLDTRPTEHLQETKHFNTYCLLSDTLTFTKVLKSSLLRSTWKFHVKLQWTTKLFRGKAVP